MECLGIFFYTYCRNNINLSLSAILFSLAPDTIFSLALSPKDTTLSFIDCSNVIVVHSRNIKGPKKIIRARIRDRGYATSPIPNTSSHYPLDMGKTQSKNEFISRDKMLNFKKNIPLVHLSLLILSK